MPKPSIIYREVPDVTQNQPGSNPFTFRDQFGSGSIIRTARNRDQYMVWSSIADGPTFVGTAADLLAAAGDHERDLVAARIDRASSTGTSAMNGAGGWDDYGLIYDQRGWILRGDFPLFADLVATDADDAADALVTPFDSEETSA